MPGASYTPRLFMPTKRFSTMSIRPTPLRPPIRFNWETISNALSRLPSTLTGTPASKPIFTFSILSGAFCGETVMPNSTSSTPLTAQVFQLARLVADVQAVLVGTVGLARPRP